MTEMEDRMVSQGNLVHQAAKNVEEMVKLSEVIKDILKGGADETSRDELDDELSELHMMIGVRLGPLNPKLSELRFIMGVRLGPLNPKLSELRFIMGVRHSPGRGLRAEG